MTDGQNVLETPDESSERSQGQAWVVDPNVTANSLDCFSLFLDVSGSFGKYINNAASYVPEKIQPWRSSDCAVRGTN